MKTLLLVTALTAASVASVTATRVALAQGTGKPASKPDPKKAAEDATKGAAADAKAADDARKADALRAEDEKKAAEAPLTVEPPHDEWNSADVEEIPTKTYLFLGAQYRGNVIPQFMLNLFIDKGATVYSNTVGITLDKRKDGFSVIPALSFTEYGTGDILFKDKDGKDIPGNYTFVNSSMKAIYATVDLLWSTKLAKNIDFEYGFGVGLGVVFGSLTNNWVYRDTNGSLGGFSKCQTEGQAPGCNKADHRNSDVAKVGDYTEKSWFDGGSKPVLFPYISIPQVGLRFKPLKQFEARLGLGFSLTGFWFGLGGAYGLEQKPKP